MSRPVSLASATLSSSPDAQHRFAVGSQSAEVDIHCAQPLPFVRFPLAGGSHALLQFLVECLHGKHAHVAGLVQLGSQASASLGLQVLVSKRKTSYGKPRVRGFCQLAERSRSQLAKALIFLPYILAVHTELIFAVVSHAGVLVQAVVLGSPVAVAGEALPAHLAGLAVVVALADRVAAGHVAGTDQADLSLQLAEGLFVLFFKAHGCWFVPAGGPVEYEKFHRASCQ